MSDEWPPRLTMTPRGAAALFLMAHCKACGPSALDALERLLKEIFDAGQEHQP